MDRIISPKIAAITFGILIVCFGIAFYIVAWQEPTATPPGGNVATPINTGSVAQSKSGSIAATEFYDANDPSYYVNPSGQSVLYGNVGIGTTTPSQQLEISGSAKLGQSLILNPVNQPSPSQAGQIYFNQNDKYLYYYNGTSWVKITGEVLSGTGQSCTSPSQCTSGFCVDGYCCNTACNTACYACNVSGAQGTCTALTGYAEDAGCTAACKGCSAGSCVNISQGSKDTFGSNTCTATHYRCNGSGSCTNPYTYINRYVPWNYTIGLVCSNAGYIGCQCGGVSCDEEYCSSGGCASGCGNDSCCAKCYTWMYDEGRSFACINWSWNRTGQTACTSLGYGGCRTVYPWQAGCSGTPSDSSCYSTCGDDSCGTVLCWTY